MLMCLLVISGYSLMFVDLLLIMVIWFMVVVMESSGLFCFWLVISIR